MVTHACSTKADGLRPGEQRAGQVSHLAKKKLRKLFSQTFIFLATNRFFVPLSICTRARKQTSPKADELEADELEADELEADELEADELESRRAAEPRRAAETTRAREADKLKERTSPKSRRAAETR